MSDFVDDAAAEWGEAMAETLEPDCTCTVSEDDPTDVAWSDNCPYHGDASAPRREAPEGGTR